MRRVPSTQPNFQIHRDRDVRALSRLALLLICGLVLASGFVFAAQQHFVADAAHELRSLLIMATKGKSFVVSALGCSKKSNT